MTREPSRLKVDVECEVDDLDGSLTREDAQMIGALRALRRIVFGGVILVGVVGAPDSYELRTIEEGRAVGEVTMTSMVNLRLVS